MSYLDPPEPLHPCRECDWDTEQDWITLEWICINPECKRSPYYKPEERTDDEHNRIA